MSVDAPAAAEAAACPALGIFERYLTLWVALCIVAGIALGHAVPGLVPGHRRGRGGPGQPAGRPC